MEKVNFGNNSGDVLLPCESIWLAVENKLKLTETLNREMCPSHIEGIIGSNAMRAPEQQESER